MVLETLISKDGSSKLEIIQDEMHESPRVDYDNFGAMVCFHSQYNLGDPHRLSRPEAIELSKRKDIIQLPLYLYDHSGITMSTTPFSCLWDSSQVGFIYITVEKAKKEMGWKVINKARREQALKNLRGEVDTYDKYLRGECYGFRRYTKKQCSCGETVAWVQSSDGWGFLGSDHRASGLLDGAGWAEET